MGNKGPVGVVDLWWEDIDSQVGRISEFWDILPKDERKRAERFRSGRHRERFIVCRGRLREILSSYWDVHPRVIRFCKGTGGKPALASDNPMIQFNLSHSQGYALFAIAYGREVGVDVEAVRPKPNAAALVARFFSTNEKVAFRTLEPHEEESAFFAGWTRKEAYVKGVGKGLRFPLDRFDVSLKSGDQNALLSVAGAPEEVDRWSLRDIELGPDFRAALAVELMNTNVAEAILVRFRC
jgi:4'-phosphopantetheinyl transferase